MSETFRVFRGLSRVSRSRPFRRLGRLAASVVACALLAACLAPTRAPTPTPLPATAAPQTAGERIARGLLAAADLTFSGTLPADGWRRCDTRELEIALKQFRQQFDVEGSSAASWVHGESCLVSAPAARLDEYAWILGSEGEASEAAELAMEMSPLSGLEPEAAAQVRETRRGNVLVRTFVKTSSSGVTRHTAEIVTLDGTSVLYALLTSSAELPLDACFDLAETYLGRLR